MKIMFYFLFLFFYLTKQEEFTELFQENTKNSKKVKNNQLNENNFQTFHSDSYFVDSNTDEYTADRINIEGYYWCSSIVANGENIILDAIYTQASIISRIYFEFHQKSPDFINITYSRGGEEFGEYETLIERRSLNSTKLAYSMDFDPIFVKNVRLSMSYGLDNQYTNKKICLKSLKGFSYDNYPVVFYYHNETIRDYKAFSFFIFQNIFSGERLYETYGNFMFI